MNNDDKDSLSPSSGNDHLYNKEDEHEGSGADASKEMESLFSALEKFEFRDLPSFSYQVCNGMVSKSSKHNIPRNSLQSTACFYYYVEAKQIKEVLIISNPRIALSFIDIYNTAFNLLLL